MMLTPKGRTLVRTMAAAVLDCYFDQAMGQRLQEAGREALQVRFPARTPPST